MKIAVALIPLLPRRVRRHPAARQAVHGQARRRRRAGDGSPLVAAEHVRRRARVSRGEADEAIDFDLFTWVHAGSFVVEWGYLVDTLTAVMLVVVTCIGMLVHYYSIGYMHGDAGYWRFFTYISLFVFSMTMLVLANNFLLLFVVWEVVGLCTYLLIGFWFRRRRAAAAGKKAFLVNRIGDFGFLWASS